jgi:hypothetical protein
MSSRFATAPLLLALVAAAACGGVTQSGVTNDPPGHDAGTSPAPDSGSGGGTGGGTGGGSGGGSGPCVQDDDCAAGEACGWTTRFDWCTADDNGQGTCVKLVTLGCQLETLAIGCDCSGKSVTWPSGCSGFPSGYAPEQLAHAGACASADAAAPPPVPTTDAGSPPVPCSTSGDCPTGQFCGYPIGACGTAAQCLPNEEMGYCDSFGEYCGCDGMNVGLSGCAQAATVPVAHAGACSGTDAGF